MMSMTDKRILIVEDEYVVALELQLVLRKAGFTTVVHAATEKEALQCMGEGAWDAAVADANLNGRGMGRVAAALMERRIPFVIVTGYSRDSLPPEVAHIPVLSKPVRGHELIREMSRLASGERSAESAPPAL